MLPQQTQASSLASGQVHHQPESIQRLNHELPLPPTPSTPPVNFPTMSPLREFGQSSPPQSPPTHSRSTSFFSFRSKQSFNNEDKPGHQRKGSAGNLTRPSVSPNVLRRSSSAQPQPLAKQLKQERSNSSPPRGFAPQFEQQQQQQPQQQAQPTMMQNNGSAGQPANGNPSPTQGSPRISMQSPQQAPPLHPEIRSVVNLTNAHAHKIYFSGPLVRRTERLPDGSKPAKDEGWSEVWAQLGGTTLSIWDMKQVQEANKQGKEVPPAYINITDAFVQVLGAVTVPGGQKYSNVLTLNNAGSNLLLFSCPSPAMLISWAAALRLSAWEKSRLEEIYTAHLVRLTLNAPNYPSTLVHGRMEGWVRIRAAGTTDWKRVWMVITAGSEGGSDVLGPGSGVASPSVQRKNRLSNMFSREVEITPPVKARITMHGGNKPKEKKKSLLTIQDVTQAFGVYPERPELISRSTLIKVEGTFGDEEMAGVMKCRDGWLLIMPELEGGLDPAAEMLKWVTALHDAFGLYGRPETWTWDPRNPISLMFAYPVGPHKDLLFLDRELAEGLDPRDDRTSSIRSRLINMLLDRMRGNDGPGTQRVSQNPPTLPPIGNSQPTQAQPTQTQPTQTQPTQTQPIQQSPQAAQQPQASGSAGPSTNNSFRLPPLAPVGSSLYPSQDKTELSPINEGSVHTQTPIHSPHGAETVESNLSRLKSLSNPHSEGLNNPHPEDLNNPHPENLNNLNNPHPQTPPTPHSLPSRQLSALSAGGASVQLQPSQSISSTQNSIRPTPTMQSAGSIHSLDRQTQSTSSNLHEPVRRDSESKVVTNPANIALPVSPPPNEISASAYLTPTPTNRPRSPASSVLTSPFSDHDHATQPRKSSDGLSVDRTSDRQSLLTSPHSPMMRQTPGPLAVSQSTSSEGKPSNYLTPPQTTPAREVKDDSQDLFSEAGALYYMSQFDGDKAANQPTKRPPTTITEASEENSEGIESMYEPAKVSPPPPNPARVGATSPSGSVTTSNSVPQVNSPVRQNNIPESSSYPVTHSIRPVSPLKPVAGVGRKPSGARAPAPTRSYTSDFTSSPPVTEEESESQTTQPFTASPKPLNQPLRKMSQPQTRPSTDDTELDALAVLQYLSTEDKPAPPQPKVEPLNFKSRQASSPSPPVSPAIKQSNEPTTYKSSFAPSKQAAERKAKAQAQQAAHLAAAAKPGRANGKRASKAEGGAWDESSDEEEEEEEEEDEDVNSDDEPIAPRQDSHGSSNASLPRPPRGQNPSEAFSDAQQPFQQNSQLRPARNLPQIPGGQYPPPEEFAPPPPRVGGTDQFLQASARRTHVDGTPIRTQAEVGQQPGAARQNMWSQVLEPGRGTNATLQQPSDTFVTLDTSETMTKAFTPQGLLSAGLQDKQDRSAKKQEELARETGASLINVPNKPPPPQMGLLGAITAHERERKREGGVGATLTEREREKRMAEDRQRRFDEVQRQQLDQMQQGGSMYGYPGYNPMMMNPMMMNPMMMNPMMTGMNPMMPMMTGQMGYPGMMPGLNPQHMLAAQQAAASAYQQAMIAFSVAGSQAGGDGQNGNASQFNPSMQGGMQGNMGGMSGMGGMGFDPRMSMMGMPMMGGGGPMGMMPQMTGMSAFDARFPPSVNNSPSNPDAGGLTPPNGLNPNGFSPNSGSPARRASPLAKPSNEGSQNNSRPVTPKI